MDSKFRVVTKLPLEKLWNEAGDVPASKLRDLSEGDVKALLQNGEVQFVVADVGCPLRWIPVKDCFDFWKTSAKLHVVEPGTRVLLQNFPDSYIFFASEWSVPDSLAIVLLECSH
jgi:hypothetical protein